MTNFAPLNKADMDYIDYDKRYRAYGELGFPYAERVYFDWIAHEFGDISNHQKLLDIGYLLTHGYDVRNDIHNTYRNHSSVSEHDVRQTLYILLAELWGGRPEYVEQMFKYKSIDGVIDELFTAVSRYYHKPSERYNKHYLKDPLDMTEEDIRKTNPWKEVADKYVGNGFLYNEKERFVCADDREMIEAYNLTAKEEHEYKLCGPAYPWYGNPLTAKVIVLSLNPGYVERESVIGKILMHLPAGLVEGYAIHLRSMLTFDCYSFLPDDIGKPNVTYRDLANLHQSWYWIDRLEKAFVNNDTALTIDDVLDRFAVVEYVGYSSEKYKPFKGGAILPSQYYTKQLIQYILHNNPDTVFIVPRNVQTWKNFLGSVWTDDRFIVSKDYLGQRFTKEILGEDYERVIAAFKS